MFLLQASSFSPLPPSHGQACLITFSLGNLRAASCLFPALSHPSILWSSCFLCPDPLSSCGFGELLPSTDDATSPSLLACHFPKGSRTLLVLSSTDWAPCFSKTPWLLPSVSLCPRTIYTQGPHWFWVLLSISSPSWNHPTGLATEEPLSLTPSLRPSLS